MKRDDFEVQFTNYRDFLRNEIYRFQDCVAIYRQLQDRKLDQLEVLNIAPAFFSVVEQALFTSIILWVDKLFDEQGQCGLFNFLTFVEHNRKWMTISELQRRKNYPDDHWVLKDRTPITLETINADRQKIRSLPALNAFRTHRDKFHGHFDRGYSFDRNRLCTEVPILWSDLTEAGQVMGTMLNNYSSDFDGNIYAWGTIGIDDLDVLLGYANTGYSTNND